jgi:hypothetical protein
MGDAEKYRANAVHCFRLANKASDLDDEQTCLNMADAWLGMIPEIATLIFAMQPRLPLASRCVTSWRGE